MDLIIVATEGHHLAAPYYERTIEQSREQSEGLLELPFSPSLGRLSHSDPGEGTRLRYVKHSW